MQFVDKSSGKRVSLASFASSINSQRITHKKNTGIWFQNESSLPTFSLKEVKDGFLRPFPLMAEY